MISSPFAFKIIVCELLEVENLNLENRPLTANRRLILVNGQQIMKG